MPLIAPIVVMGVALLWEMPNLTRNWGRRQRWVFIACWVLALTFGALQGLHVAVPTLPDLTDRLFGRWARHLLRPRPNIFW